MDLIHCTCMYVSKQQRRDTIIITIDVAQQEADSEYQLMNFIQNNILMQNSIMFQMK